MTKTTSCIGEENVSRFSDLVKFQISLSRTFSATCPLCLGIVCTQITPSDKRHHYGVEKNPYYYHTKAHALGSTYSMETKSKLATNLNMSTPQSFLMAKQTSPLDSLGDSTPKSSIICGHLLGTNDHKLRKRKLLQIMPSN